MDNLTFSDYLEIAQSNFVGVDNAHCVITEAFYYDVGIVQSEATLLYSARLKNLPLQIQSSNLQLYWALDEYPHNDTANSADGFTFYDLSGNGNNGTATGSNSQAETILSYPPSVIMQ